MSHGPVLPIRVLPGASELMLDQATRAYQLNVGFTVSFAVKELLEALTMLDTEEVNVAMTQKASMDNAERGLDGANACGHYPRPASFGHSQAHIRSL